MSSCSVLRTQAGTWRSEGAERTVELSVLSPKPSNQPASKDYRCAGPSWRIWHDGGLGTAGMSIFQKTPGLSNMQLGLPTASPGLAKMPPVLGAPGGHSGQRRDRPGPRTRAPYLLSCVPLLMLLHASLWGPADHRAVWGEADAAHPQGPTPRQRCAVCPGEEGSGVCRQARHGCVQKTSEQEEGPGTVAQPCNPSTLGV